MQIFEFNEYKSFVNRRVEQMANGGRGQFRRIAEHLNVHPVVMSQVFRGDKHLTLEQAFAVSSFFGLSEMEREYFILLVQKERAGTHEFQKHTESQLKKLRQNSKEVKNRVPQHIALNDESRPTFYSHWLYTGVRLATSIDGLNTIDRLAERFNTSAATIAQIIEFLVKHGLCVEKRGKLAMGPSHTHLGSDSLLIKSRQVQWRLKGFEAMDGKKPGDLFYTGPMSITDSVAQEIREELVDFISRMAKMVEKSKSEELACLNIDWFKF